MQEHELSADLITFHQAVSQLQIMEDELLECHARVTEESEKWLELDRRFLTHTAEVDYDQEGKIFSFDAFFRALILGLWTISGFENRISYLTCLTFVIQLCS